jgi:hypothetical protein
LLKSISENIRDNEREFTKIPLQCKLLAEAFDDHGVLPDPFAINKLYDTFWVRKIEIYFTDKLGINKNNRNFEKALIDEQKKAKSISSRTQFFCFRNRRTFVAKLIGRKLSPWMGYHRDQ